MLPIILIIVSLIAVAFFAGVETAYIRANRLHIELKKQQGSRRGAILSNFVKHEHEFLVTMLIGNAIILVLIGKQMDDLFSVFFVNFFKNTLEQPDPSKVVIILLTTIVTTCIVLFFAEFIPKALFSINPSGILHFLAFPIHWVYTFLRPLVRFFYWLAKKILSLFTIIDQNNDELTFGTDDLKHFINDVQSKNDEVDTELIKNTLDLAESTVADCMIPRPSIIAFDVNNSLDDLYKLFIDSGHSKLIIYDQSIDNTLGYIHHSQLLKRPNDIRSLVRDTLLVPEVMPAVELMNRFIREKRNIAIVVDEFGGTAGIIALEDILEEIFGEIDDEYDKDNATEEIISEREFRFSGNLEIEYLNDKYRLALRNKEEYSTLSGYIIQTNEAIPEVGDQIRLESYDFIIEEMSDTRVEQVRLERWRKDDE
jgi:putative hemolysin